jgi:predicted dienelactone hydrolase
MRYATPERKPPIMSPSTPLHIVTIKPIAVPTDDRPFPLQVKVTAPVGGSELPVIVFSHGNAWSMDGYEPVVDR